MHEEKPHLSLTPHGEFKALRETDFQLANSLLDYVNGKKPMALTFGTDRMALTKLMDQSMKKKIRISIEAKVALHEALNAKRQEPPVILPPTDYERFGHINDHSTLVADCNYIGTNDPMVKALIDRKPMQRFPVFSNGATYNVRHSTIEFRSRYKKPRLKLEEGQTIVVQNEYELRGHDHSLVVRDDHGNQFRFRDNDTGPKELPCVFLWKYFKKPEVPTIQSSMSEKYAETISTIEDLEFLNGFKCCPGQKDYVAALSLTDYALVAAETGTGKSFIAILLDLLKNTKRTLLLAPKGTIRDGEKDGQSIASQWMKEFQRFSPSRKVFKLFSEKDYLNIIKKHGELPSGVFFSYHTQFFKGMECLPQSWSVETQDEKFHKWMMGKYGYSHKEGGSHGIGACRNGISCIAEATLATRIGRQFDMVILDEAHLICNPRSAVTRNMLRLQAKYKFALTATPIPNEVSNLYPLMGWLAVPNWYQGNVSNPRWPYNYSAHDLNRFVNDHQSKEHDETARRRMEYKAPKKSPILSNKQLLLRKVKKIIAFTSKADCNPDLVDCTVNTIRVPFGKYQKQLYSYNMELANIPHNDHRTKHGVQYMRLRGICADPLGRDFNEFPGFKMVDTNVNPKLIAILSKITSCVQAGEQVIHVSAFQGLNTELETRLHEAGITTSRIDGTPGLDQAAEAAEFKAGRTQVLLMGIKCAVGHSFDQCKRLIIGSLEWSYGALNQAMGRIYRLNSPEDVTVDIILIGSSVEEMMFDKLAQKRDAATLVMHGESLPHDYQDVGVQEIFAEHFLSFSSDSDDCMNEHDCEDEWTQLQLKLQDSRNNNNLALEAIG